MRKGGEAHCMCERNNLKKEKGKNLDVGEEKNTGLYFSFPLQLNKARYYPILISLVFISLS
jgi:hypothetical protein